VQPHSACFPQSAHRTNLFIDKVIVTTLLNKMLEKFDFAGVIRLLDEVMILQVTVIGLLCTSL